MAVFGTLASIALILLTLIDGFETILQPRRVTHRFRFARFFYRTTWSFWRWIALRLPAGKRREGFLSVFAPLSLLGLFATWVVGLIFGFALLHRSLGESLQITTGPLNFWTYVYMSGTTFFTLGYGDVTPVTPFGRGLAVAEAGLGFGFLAVIIGYLPVLAQAFSRREVTISLLDARAGSPPSAAAVLVRLAKADQLQSIDPLLSQWEVWAAELLESSLSFPVLIQFRSQHDNQSWLAALTTILDTCAILIAWVEGKNLYQAQLTFAMARHAAVDLALVLKSQPLKPELDRLSSIRQEKLEAVLREANLQIRADGNLDTRLAELRGMYEPFIDGIAARYLFSMPPIMPDEFSADNWQRSAWMRKTPGIGSLSAVVGNDSHFG